MIYKKNKKKLPKVDDMTDEEFDGYIKDAQNGKGNLSRAAEEEGEIERFSKIKEMAMKLFETDNAEEALYQLIKTAVNAKKNPADNAEAVSADTDGAQKVPTKDEAWQADILSQAAELSESNPDFNFEQLMKNEDFRRELYATGSVASAYRKTKKSKRISENGIAPTALSGGGRRSPASMSDADFKKYIDSLTKRTSI